MNDQKLLQWILGEIEQANESTPKHIIRLQESMDCLEFVREIQASIGDHPGARAIIPLPLINGLSCPIRSTADTGKFRQLLEVEEDRKPAVVHGFSSRMPSGGSSSSSSYSRGRPFVPWGVRHIQAPTAWKRSKGDNIRVGIIDTGIDYSHPDLQSSIGGGINLIHRHMLPHDDNGHGTHISGTIAASARLGMFGIAPYATVYAIKAFDQNGTSYVTDIVQGIEWCVRNRIHIINMSFGMKTRSHALEAAVHNASREGVFIVASSGNEGKKGFVDYPARFENTIAVGATTRDKRIASFSNKGSKIDIYAPGEKITSTWLNGKYHELSGTSMATSHVSGVIALILAFKPQVNLKTLLHYLQSSATPISTTISKAGFLGEINALRAVRAANREKKKPG